MSKQHRFERDELTFFTPFGGNVYLVHEPNLQNTALDATLIGQFMVMPSVKLQDGVCDVAGLQSCPGGWVDLEGKRIIFTLPVHKVQQALKHGANLLEVLSIYDSLWEAYNTLSPWIDPLLKQRVVCDWQISVGWMHS